MRRNHLGFKLKKHNLNPNLNLIHFVQKTCNLLKSKLSKLRALKYKQLTFLPTQLVKIIASLSQKALLIRFKANKQKIKNKICAGLLKYNKKFKDIPNKMRKTKEFKIRINKIWTEQSVLIILPETLTNQKTIVIELQ